MRPKCEEKWEQREPLELLALKKTYATKNALARLNGILCTVKKERGELEHSTKSEPGRSFQRRRKLEGKRRGPQRLGDDLIASHLFESPRKRGGKGGVDRKNVCGNYG